ncbi:TPA: hypothetical protein ACPIZ7_000603 [Haemophilus influenzae]|uniref:Uncharacterized protein n=1 Tax=Haemophilus influenzae (strain 86-028NP) TaxID=281310 RepID=Q4QK10_HAEI8|nr:hypothetical protein [Haemophilus influenzae]DAO41311.1 MAG TPA: hypothetical protein [Caudoviricetes sp.]AAX88637.1 hypothetical protein NTHI1876 [Haemophilus influenzae 86-028NP]AJO87412.1 hypothetical protein NTHI477_00368 [Haemophilus influenzae]MDF3109305.1 hypothetical protein [Haemophilus influenzae]MDF3111108.1 hypothetical protein [Haemophilus influenzae]
MRRTTLFLAIAAALPCLANTYTVPFRDGPFVNIQIILTEE